ncbi:hypothetical protein H632_c128p0 [Helicosporidium sp. ATCC 50920]|nr:hypothetical protein H632_c128p0 [Helicosporidium sp. ATCC 50920]|eukprot:KDD76717.1 hypothetical protein H632_c128p0 [Helicosporidium sp. ATCC 50920]
MRIGLASPHLCLSVHPTICSDFESLLKHRRDLSSLHPREVFRAVGVSFEDRQALIVQLLPQTPLLLAHEPANPVDPNAVAIHLLYGARLGYVPQAQTQSFRAARPAVLGTVQSVGATSGGRWGFSVLAQPRVPAVLLSALPGEVEGTLESGVGAAMEKLERSETFLRHCRQSALSGLPASPLVRDELAAQPARCQLTGAGGARLRAIWELHPAQAVIRLTGARHPSSKHASYTSAYSSQLIKYRSNMTMCRFPELARFLGSQGISSLRFDHAMAIQSESERQGPFKIGNHDDEVDDAHVAVGELAMRGFRVVCLLGHSKGGFNALFYAATHRDVPSVVCLSGRFRVRVGLMQRYGKDVFERLAKEKRIEQEELTGEKWVLTEEDVLHRLAVETPALTAKVPSSTRLMFVHGREDAIVACQESVETAGMVPHARLVLVHGDHNFTGKGDFESMAPHILAFVKEQIALLE